MLKTITRLAETHIYFTTVSLSLLISLWLFVSRDIISRDAVLYVNTAQAFLDGGIGAAFKTWGWPFYSIVIAIIHKITGLSLELSAYVLTFVLETVISLAFVKLYSLIAFDRARLWVAMLFILTFVTLSNYKGDIWREYGFWAFSLIAVHQFILYHQSKKLINAFYWQLCILVATLFRIEGVVFAVLAPFYILFSNHSALSERFKYLFKLNFIFYPLALLALITVLLSVQLQALILNNLPEQIVYFSPAEIFGNFNNAADNFVKYVLPFDYSENYSYLMIGSGLLAMLLFKLINNFNIVYLGIWLTGSYKHWITLKPESRVIYFFAAIAFLILIVFITSRLFVSTRYTVFLLLLIGLIFTQYLDYFISYLYQYKHKFWLIALSIFIAIQFLDSVISTGAKKFPMQYSGEWLAQHIKPGEKIACNEIRFTYYSNQRCFLREERFYSDYNEADINFLKNKQFSYLLLWVKHKNTALLEKLKAEKNLIFLKQFKNKKDDVALVYKIRN
jgi:hypothetical protein